MAIEKDSQLVDFLENKFKNYKNIKIINEDILTFIKNKNFDKNIIVFGNNFHGRTTTIKSFSNDTDAKNNFGPYTPGFISVEYNNLDLVRTIKDYNKYYSIPEEIFNTLKPKVMIFL